TAKGHKPYIIGHRAAVLGAVAYVGCAVEIHEQLTVLGLQADVIALASGSGTQAGVALGVKALGTGAKVLGFSPSLSDEGARRHGIARLANEAAEVLGLDTHLSPEEIVNTHAYVGESYGIVTQAGLDAIELVARTEGILLDPVYTAKAMAGVIAQIRQGVIPKDATLVFIHTGGNPALFAYQPELVAHGGYAQKIVTDLAGGIA
ncbi:MAG: pyridoxal-phosphate dependent enzyme, partial [Abditibacteriales bacterium]|nr:pyridoxal-phosphate dependent enzyme [Abditibacteriales bacterium]MDW8365581.1 pyridoxal-phosphate dependent enzyme [Abditibacteriales bacterium]